MGPAPSRNGSKSASNIRLIGRFDIKGPNLIKGVQLEGNRVVGDPVQFAKRYYEHGIDELVLLDSVASLYGRNNLRTIIESISSQVFIPITVGGGIRSVENVYELLRSGADKVAVNTAAVNNPSLITSIAEKFGSQCMVLSVEAKRDGKGRWEALTDNGREHTKLDAVEWLRQGVELGAGEVLLTSVDRDGTGKGFDLELLEAVRGQVGVPVILSGGMGKPEDFVNAVLQGGVDAVAMGYVLHWERSSLFEIKQAAKSAGIHVSSH